MQQPRVAPASQSLTPTQSGLLQRKCACGGTPGPDGECAECRKKRLGLQRKATSHAEPSTVPSIVHEVLRSPGQPLDPATRAFMEPRFGHTFSRVRVHTDEKAAESARAVDALAYTVGQDVVLGRGQHTPATPAGRQLLAHELTHTLQQSEASAVSREGLIVSAPGDAAEWQADEVARRVSRQGLQESTPHPLLVSPTGPHLARQPAGGKAESFTVEERIRVELERQIAADDDEAIEQRRQRLRELFESVSPSEARNLHDRLSKGMEGDEFAKFFHLRLATATREEMLGILQRKSVEAEATRLREAEKKVEADLKIAREAHARATAMLDAVAGGGLDPDLIDQVRGQGESVQETIELLAESKSILASMPEDKRGITMGAGSIELQVYIHSVGHLVILEKIVSFELPDAVTNQDEVEEKLDEYANWHEEWIGANEDVGALAADIVGLGLGLEEKIEMNLLVGQYFTEVNEQGQALKAVDEHVDEIIAEAKAIKEKAEKRAAIEKVADVILTLRGRGRRLRRPPKIGGRTRTKAPKRSAKKRKQFKKPKDTAKQKPKERRKKKDRKKEQRAKAYPICWATQLGPPLLSGVPIPFFVRTPGVERDTNDAKQRRMQLWYRENVDPGFRAAGYHVHHIVPLFLGGLDAAAMNLTIIPARLHLKGHAVLAKQPQMAKPPGGLRPLTTNLYDHPAGTLYRLKGFKTEANQTC
jgi:Domain of unknown function (DUF4157)